MRTMSFVRFCLPLLTFNLLLASCASHPSQHADVPVLPEGQLLLALGKTQADGYPSLLVLDPNDGKIISSIPLPIPPECAVGSLHPAPRGRWLAVELECNGGPLVETFSVESGALRVIMPIAESDSHFLAWRSDGESLYVKAASMSNPRIALVNASTGRAQLLSLSPFVYDLAVSPDGKRIAFSLTFGIGYGSETYVASANGDNPQRIINDPTHIVTFLRWSPGDDSVAFIRMEDSSTPFTVGELAVSDLSGANIRVIGRADAGHGFAPAWSPDGTQIAFVVRENESGAQADSVPEALISNIALTDVSSGSTRPVTSFPDARVGQPAFSPDGRFLAFTVIRSSTIILWVNDAPLAIDGVTCCALWLAGK
jgi:Tol biopolymer transport system component